MRESLHKFIFVLSCLFLLFILAFSSGLIVARYNLWPYESIVSAWRGVKSFTKYGVIIPENLYNKAPADASRQRLTLHNSDLQIDGYYIFMGWDSTQSKYSAWLYDNKGGQLHTWSWDYSSLDADGPLNGSDTPHAFKVLPDGSLIVSFDGGDVMARLDPCGQPIWAKKGVYHHSLERAEDGSYWTWRSEGTPYGHYHYLENFNPETGATIREISLVDDVIKNPKNSPYNFGIRSDHTFVHLEKTPENRDEHDLFHPNDIDILYKNLETKFNNYKAGDLLLSFRNLNLIAVLDPEDNGLKWLSHGPWKFQHDPDFTEDGKISVYNNNTGLNRSEIIKIDPTTRAISNDLEKSELFFYSHSMGKHQYLPNGNVLIVVPGEGRVLEVTKHGKKVLEFNNVLEDQNGLNGHVENGMWVPPDYFEKLPECKNGIQQEG